MKVSILELKRRVGTRPVDILLGTTVAMGKLTHCPFHNDSTASFGPFLRNGLPHWKCQGCQWHGDVIDFFVKRKGISKSGAIKLLSDGQVQSVAVPAAKSKSKGWDTAPWDEWKDLTEETYSEICTAREGHGYMPQFETLVSFGFRELKKPGRSTLVGHPITLWDPTKVDCIKYFSASTYAKKKAFFFDGPYRKQDRLFGLGKMPRSAKTEQTRMFQNSVFIVEGQWDAMAMWELGYRAYGVLSAGQSQIVKGIPEELSRCFDYIFLMLDNDEGGQRCRKQLLPWFEPGKAFAVFYPAGTHDFCDLRDQRLIEGVDESLLEVLEKAALQEKEALTEPVPPSNRAITMPYKPGIDIRCVDDAEIKDTVWLWPYRIVFRGLNVFNGPGEVGKTTAALDIIARATNGADWFDAENTFGKCDALLVADEDSIEEDLKPSLLAAGADTKRVHYVAGFNEEDADHTTRMLALDEDCEKLRTKLQEYPDIKIILFDPLTSYLGKAKKNNDQEIRTVLMKLRRLARETGLAVISVDHFNKDTKQTIAVYRQSGTQALTAVPRIVWSFLPVDENEPIETPSDPDATYGKMLTAKGNKLPPQKRKGLLYKIVGKKIPGIIDPVGRTVWIGMANQSANQALAGGMAGSPKSADAAEWVTKYLAEGPKSSEEFYAAARSAGFNTKTEPGKGDDILQTACKAAKIESWQTRDGWLKGLPGSKKEWLTNKKNSETKTIQSPESEMGIV